MDITAHAVYKYVKGQIDLRATTYREDGFDVFRVRCEDDTLARYIEFSGTGRSRWDEAKDPSPKFEDFIFACVQYTSYHYINPKW